MFFPTVVLGTMNAVLSPVVQGTEAMVHQQENTLAQLVKRRDKLQEAAYLKNPETAYLVSNEKFDEKIEEMGIIGPEDAVTIAGMYAERAAYQTKQWVMKLFRDFMELLYNAAGLIIDTLRTFILIVLSILGPVVFGISVWMDFRFAQCVVLALHIGLSVVASEFYSFGFACQDSSFDGTKRHCSAFECELCSRLGNVVLHLSSSSLALWDISACPLWPAGSSKPVAVLGLMVAMSIAWQRVAHKEPTQVVRLLPPVWELPWEISVDVSKGCSLKANNNNILSYGIQISKKHFRRHLVRLGYTSSSLPCSVWPLRLMRSMLPTTLLGSNEKKSMSLTKGNP